MNLARDTCSGWLVWLTIGKTKLSLNTLRAMVVAEEGFEAVLGKIDDDGAHC